MAPKMTSEQWDEEAKTNIRLVPKYGHVAKSAEQLKADSEFISTALRQDTTNRKASNHLIMLGFRYLLRDVRTAMYRFNQAYLLDSTNSDIYWGYGAVYMTIGEYANAEKQYLEGLAADPKNSRILTDYGTYFFAQWVLMPGVSEMNSKLDSAIFYMMKSYQLNNKDENTTFKLSSCYLYKGDCDSAWKFYDECKALGGHPITEDYTNTLSQQCAPKK